MKLIMENWRLCEQRILWEQEYEQFFNNHFVVIEEGAVGDALRAAWRACGDGAGAGAGGPAMPAPPAPDTKLLIIGGGAPPGAPGPPA